MSKANTALAAATADLLRTDLSAAPEKTEASAKPEAPAADNKAKPPGKPAPVAAEPAKAQPIVALLSSEIKARESGVHFNTWEVVPPTGTPLEHVLLAEFWANVSQKMRPGDTVIVFPRDCRWYAELLVWDVGQNWAHVEAVLAKQRPQFAAVAGVVDDFEIVRDPIDGWIVKRRSTGAKMKGNLASHEEGRKWLAEHQRALRA